MVVKIEQTPVGARKQLSAEGEMCPSLTPLAFPMDLAVVAPYFGPI